MSQSCDFLITGAGILGLALAKSLKKRHPASSITILEKEAALGLHASGRNSGVLHSGIYYPKGTVKAQVCKTGSVLMQEFAAEHDIPCQKTGKIILATRADELPIVDTLLQNARDNGIRAEKLDEAGVRRLEPKAGPNVGGIHSPDTAVIDSKAVLHKLAELLQSQGVEILRNAEFVKADPVQKTVTTRNGETYAYGFFFNCGGSQADRVARDFHVGGDYTLIPFKGLYYKLHPSKNSHVKASIYPVPNPLVPFLGVHFTRVISGDVYVGPTAMPALGRENYGFFEGFRLGEALRILPELAALYIRNNQNFRGLVHQEIGNYKKSHFFKSAQRLLQDLKPEDLLPCPKVGIRPQLVHTREKTLQMDYVIERTENSLHLLNAISPAFTSSLAFADFVLDRFLENK